MAKRLAVAWCVAAVVLLSALCVFAANVTLQFYFVPQIMNDITGELTVDVNLRNFDSVFGDGDHAICAVTLTYQYDDAQFLVKTGEDGLPLLLFDDTTLLSSMEDVELSASGSQITVFFMDSTLEQKLISRDGTLFRFTLIAKNPSGLWNSFDQYPLRFVAGSLGAVAYRLSDTTVQQVYQVEGLDAMVGGYNKAPSLTTPPVGRQLTFALDTANVLVDGQEITTDAAPFLRDGTWMIPLRHFAENAGMRVEWNGDTLTANAYADFKSLEVRLSDGTVYINANERQMEPKPEEIGGRIYLPVTFVTMLYPQAQVTADGGTVTLEIP